MYSLDINAVSFIRLTSSLGGQYHAFFGLLPDYNFGFTLLSAADLDDLGSVIVNGIPNIVGNLMLPALDDVAKKQAICDFAGHYTSNTGNSSMKIAVSDARPGLEVTQWISNSVDLLEVLTATTPNLVYRIVPNHLFSGDKVVVRFAGLQQESDNMLSFDTSGLSQHMGTDISGFLGFDLLHFLVLSIDYRDGLVDFQYSRDRGYQHIR